jgi:iron-sulfur cluster assembly protein
METTTLRRPRPAPITVTEDAARRIAEIIAKAPQPGDETVETPGGTLFIDGGSLMYLIGSRMDWKEDDFAAGFVFENPNAKGSCGCGESFTV